MTKQTNLTNRRFLQKSTLAWMFIEQAVAKNMEIKCRCHGLSGSCSLKTCWLRLPDFQQIGAYLKRKYDGSIHLPTAINVNRLIPMMDRQEISAILLQNNQEQEHQALALSNQVAPRAEFAALTSERAVAEKAANSNSSGRTNVVAAQMPAHFSYYERHKQLERLVANQQQQQQQQQQHRPQSSPTSSSASNQTSLFLHGDEAPITIVPMSQQQYQSLLRDMKLCNSNLTSGRRQLHKRHLASGKQARRHYNHQRTNNNNAGQQQAIGQLLQSQNRDELVHLHKSPDYCEADLRHGFGGVQARACSLEPQAANSCDKLCCGRGFERRETQLRYKCDCKFQYCCTIHCNYCHKKVVEYVCR